MSLEKQPVATGLHWWGQVFRSPKRVQNRGTNKASYCRLLVQCSPDQLCPHRLPCFWCGPRTWLHLAQVKVSISITVALYWPWTKHTHCTSRVTVEPLSHNNLSHNLSPDPCLEIYSQRHHLVCAQPQKVQKQLFKFGGIYVQKLKEWHRLW